MNEKDTRERILDAAEQLFAEKGIKETSIREVTKMAGANLAAVNYHFGSKEGLIRETISRRLKPINKERLSLLDSLETKTGGSPLPVESILYALFSPAIEFCLSYPDFMRLAGRMLFESDKALRAVFLSQFDEVIIRFKAALSRSLPDLPERELLWRIHFLAGAMIHTYTNHSILEAFSGGLCKIAEDKEVLDRLINFCAAGLRAPLRVESANGH
jgi:AcrR family transcriptional regulator